MAFRFPTLAAILVSGLLTLPMLLLG